MSRGGLRARTPGVWGDSGAGSQMPEFPAGSRERGVHTFHGAPVAAIMGAAHGAPPQAHAGTSTERGRARGAECPRCAALEGVHLPRRPWVGTDRRDSALPCPQTPPPRHHGVKTGMKIYTVPGVAGSWGEAVSTSPRSPWNPRTTLISAWGVCTVHKAPRSWLGGVQTAPTRQSQPGEPQSWPNSPPMWVSEVRVKQASWRGAQGTRGPVHVRPVPLQRWQLRGEPEGAARGESGGPGAQTPGFSGRGLGTRGEREGGARTPGFFKRRVEAWGRERGSGCPDAWALSSSQGGGGGGVRALRVPRHRCSPEGEQGALGQGSPGTRAPGFPPRQWVEVSPAPSRAASSPSARGDSMMALGAPSCPEALIAPGAGGWIREASGCRAGAGDPPPPLEPSQVQRLAAGTPGFSARSGASGEVRAGWGPTHLPGLAMCAAIQERTQVSWLPA